MPATKAYSELQGMVRRAALRDGSTTFDDDVIDRAVAAALSEHLPNFRRWRWMEGLARINTLAPYSTGQLTAVPGSTTLTGTGTAWVAAHVGGFIEIDGQDNWYEIVARNSDTDITIANQYNHPDGGAGNPDPTDYRIVFPQYALPDDFLSMIDFYDLQGQIEMSEVSYANLLHRMNHYNGASQPYVYAYGSKRPTNAAGDPDVTRRIWFWPPPTSGGTNTQFWYDLLYHRRLKVPDKNDLTEIVDWPDEQFRVLQICCLMAAYDELGDVQKAQAAEYRFQRVAQDAAKADWDSDRAFILGQGNTPARPHWYDGYNV